MRASAHTALSAGDHLPPTGWAADRPVGGLNGRIVPGLYLTAHGLQKASPRLGFGGISGTAEDFARSGVRGGRAPAVLTAVLQIGAGILLTIGLLTPLAAMAAAGVMIVATQTRLRVGFWSQRGGFDSPRCWPPSAWRSSGPAAAAASVSRPLHRRGRACDVGTQLDADSLAEATAVVGEVTAPASWNGCRYGSQAAVGVAPAGLVA